MISFKEFLMEGSRTPDYTDDQLEKLAKNIKKDCGFYLGLIKNNVNRYRLFRGISGLSSTQISFSKLKVNKNRKPKDTALDIHEIMDEWMYEKFGIKHRSQSLFTTGYFDLASDYGTTNVLIFPVGKFEFLWSSVYDDIFLHLPIDGKEPEMIEDILYNGKYSNKNFTNGIASGHEIMIHCNEYYALNVGRNEAEAEKLIDILGKYL